MLKNGKQMVKWKCCMTVCWHGDLDRAPGRGIGVYEIEVVHGHIPAIRRGMLEYTQVKVVHEHC